MTIQYIQDHIKNKTSITHKYLGWRYTRNERKRHKITKFQNFYNWKKTPINPYCYRADNRFPNVTPCNEKCNILNYIVYIILHL